MNFIQWWHSVFDRSKEVTGPHYNLMKDAHETGRLEGREECAQVCEAEGEGHRDGFGQHCAAMIRRSNNQN